MVAPTSAGVGSHRVNTRPDAIDGSWRALSWTWDRSVWDWNPSDGAWKPKFGVPNVGARVTLVTKHARPAERFDLWHELTRQNWVFDAPDADRRLDFQAGGEAVITPRGFAASYESDPISGERPQGAAPASDGVLIGLVLAGERLSETRGDVQLRSRAGDFFAYDEERPARFIWPERHRAAYFVLPRQDVRAALGGDVPAPSLVARALRARGLAPMVAGQLRLFAEQSSLLSDIEAEAAVASIADLMLAALRAGASERLDVEDRATAGAMVLAARRYIDGRLSQSDLTVDEVAIGVGCSRAGLYRAFAELGYGIAETIRDARLARLRQLLERGSMSVGEAALACGFVEPRTMQRQFKDRYGHTPRDFRAMARGG